MARVLKYVWSFYNVMHERVNYFFPHIFLVHPLSNTARLRVPPEKFSIKHFCTSCVNKVTLFSFDSLHSLGAHSLAQRNID